jgi:tetratricopeptide (TPR) repeat protein
VLRCHYAAAALCKIPRFGGAARLHGQQEPGMVEWLELATTACRLDPFLVKAHAKRAELLRLVGRSREALEVVESALDWAPHAAALLVERARALAMVGRLLEAEPIARQAVSFDPTSEDAASGLVFVLRARGKSAEAVRFASSLVAVRPQSIFHRVVLGTLLNAAERWEEAREVLTAARDDIAWQPRWQMPFSEAHLDSFDATTLAIEGELALAVNGAGGDPMPHVEELFRLSACPHLYVSPAHYVARLRASRREVTQNAA